MKYSADGQHLILGFAERTLKFLDVRINQIVFNSNDLHKGIFLHYSCKRADRYILGGVYAIECAPGGTQIATGSDDGSLRMIELGANTVARRLAHINPGELHFYEVNDVKISLRHDKNS